MSVVYQYQEPNSPKATDENFRKKLFLLGGFVVVCLVIMGVVLALGSSSGVKEEAGAEGSIATTFVTAVANQDINSLKLLVSDGTDATDDEIKTNVIDALAPDIKLDTCQEDENSTEDGDYAQHSLNCQKTSIRQAEDEAAVAEAGTGVSDSLTLVVTTNLDKVIFYQIVSEDQTSRSIDDVITLINET